MKLMSVQEYVLMHVVVKHDDETGDDCVLAAADKPSAAGTAMSLRCSCVH